MASNMSRQMFFLGEGLVTCIAFATLSCSNPTHLVVVGRKSGLPESSGVSRGGSPVKDTHRFDMTQVQMRTPTTGIEKTKVFSCNLRLRFAQELDT
jgi:hypothetical protein